MKKLLVYLQDFKKECVLGPLFKLLEASFELIVPLIVAAIIDRGIPGNDIPYILRMIAWLGILALVGLISAPVERKRIFRYVPSVSPGRNCSASVAALHPQPEPPA